jgi:transposase
MTLLFLSLKPTRNQLTSKMAKAQVSEQKRWQIVAYHKLKYTYRHIASLCHVSTKCVVTTVRNYKLTGGIKDKPRPGRPKKTSPREDRQLVKMVKGSPKSSLRELNASWVDECGSPRASKTTISRRLLEVGLNSYKATKCPFLMEKDYKIRLDWCRERKNWSFDKWSNVIWSDESNFELFNRKNAPLVRRFKEDKLNPNYITGRVQKCGGSVGIWGCFSANGTGCCYIYRNRLDAEGYLNILEDSLIPSIDLLIDDKDFFMFQQDNAPCHKAKKVLKWFEERQISLLEWPARSPDLNPIENIWNLIDLELGKMQITSLAELELALVKLWNNFTKMFV